MTVVEELEHRLHEERHVRPGFCAVCRNRPVAGGQSETSHAARALKLCGRHYNDKVTRRRRRRQMGLGVWRRNG